jgi:predicted ester cyclase
MRDDNKAILRRFVDEVVNRRNLAAARDLVAEDVVDHTPIPAQAPGLAGLKQSLAALRVASPNAWSTEDEVIAEGDVVVYRGTLRGAHKGEFLKREPTGREFTATEVRIVRIAGGRIVEHWWLPDVAALLGQLGAEHAHRP